MSTRLNIAIETSSPRGSIAIGRGDELVVTRSLPDRKRHSVELMSTIDEMMRAQDAGPGDLAEVYVSAGPGSFTGLRVAISVAQMLGEVLGVKLVSVPTIEAAAQNVLQPAEGAGPLSVAINTKRDTAYCALFQWDGGRWAVQQPADVRHLRDWLASLPRPVQLLGDHLPELETSVMQGMSRLPDELATARAEYVWQIGRRLAQAGMYVDPARLLPIYARRPEAVELWEQRGNRQG